jgi:ubiquinone/menaquinone biosynthesis C-methylase UbiE
MTDVPREPRPTDPDGPRREHWESVYAGKAEDQVSWYQARPGASLALVARAAAEAGARIVDVGGGASRLVDALLERGLGPVTVLDLAAGALEKARARLGGRASAVTWVVGDVLTWEPDGSFDVWHDRAVFHFMVSREDREVYRAVLRRALRAGGQAVVGTFAPDGPERCSGLPVARYDPESLAAELGPVFRLVETLREEHVTPAGKVQAFQFCRLVRS